MRIKKGCAIALSLALCLQFTPTFALAENVAEGQPKEVTNQADGPSEAVAPEVNSDKSQVSKQVDDKGVQNKGEVPKKSMLKSAAPSELRTESEPAQSDTIEINSKEDFLKFYNTETGSLSPVLHDEMVYGVKGKTINLNTDIVVSSDEINMQIDRNKRYKNYEHSFQLVDSNFHGNNHKITITQGKRTIYPLFGSICNLSSSDGEKTIDNLNIEYKGDVKGSGFARYINRSFQKHYININNVSINVEGNILPIFESEVSLKTGDWKESDPIGMGTIATGFAQSIDYTRAKDVTINVGGNIGFMKQPKYKDVLSDQFYNEDIKKYPNKFQGVVNSRAYGFVERYSFGNEDVGFNKVSDININIGDSLIAHSTCCSAEAALFGGHLGKMEMSGIKLKTGHDVKAIIDNEDNSIDSKYYESGYYSYTSYASGFGFGFHYLDGADITIGGNITVDNRMNYKNSIAALGLNYDDGIPHGLEKKIPRTIKNVNLDVAGNVQALTDSKKPFDIADGERLPQVAAIAGAGNFDEPFENKYNGAYSENNFENNKINVKKEVKVETNKGNGLALLWGNLTGNNNSFYAEKITLSAVNDKWDVAAPCYEVFKAENNNIKVGSIESKTKGTGYVAGFAYRVNKANQNNLSIGAFNTQGVSYFGGYACRLSPQGSRSDVKCNITDEHIKLPDELVFNNPDEEALIGGFVAENKGIDVVNCSVEIPKMNIAKTNQPLNIGGFVAFPHENSLFSECVSSVGDINVECKSINLGGFSGYSSKPVVIKDSKANLKNITVNTLETANVGGFLGKSFNCDVENSAAFIDGNITVNKANWPNVGGFGGYLYNVKIKNLAAQTGGNIDISKSQGKAYAGGFAGHCYGTAIDKSTALTFGNITGDASKMAGLSAFVGTFDMNPKDTSLPKSSVTKSAAYLGGDISRANNIIQSGLSSIIADGNISDFTLLVDKETSDKQENNKRKKEEYAGVFNPNKDAVKLDKLHLVEVENGKRTAYPVNVNIKNDGSADITFGKKLNELEIAGRPFQDDFWGAKAVDTTQPGKFNYIKKHDNVDNLTFYTPDISSLQKDDQTGKTLTTDSFTTRHLAAMADGITYDILGIKGSPICQLKYDPNGATGGKLPAEATKYDEGSEVAVLGNTGKLVKEGYVFDNWNTKADGTGESYKAGDKITMNANTVLYAHWIKESPASYNPMVSAKLIPENGATIPKDYKNNFTFKLEAVSGTDGKGNPITVDLPMPEGTMEYTDGKYKLLVLNDVTGKDDIFTENFGDIAFPAPGTYKYRITQVDGLSKDITYDNSVYEITIKVTRKDETLNAKLATIKKDGEVISPAEEGGEDVDPKAVLFANQFNKKPDETPTTPGTPSNPNTPTSHSKPKPVKKTNTGDDFNPVPFVLMMAGSVGIIAALKSRKKRVK